MKRLLQTSVILVALVLSGCCFGGCEPKTRKEKLQACQTKCDKKFGDGNYEGYLEKRRTRMNGARYTSCGCESKKDIEKRKVKTALRKKTDAEGCYESDEVCQACCDKMFEQPKVGHIRFRASGKPSSYWCACEDPTPQPTK